jgi:hypothetical protein
MEFANATKFNRKSGEAEESAVSASQYQMLTGETVLFIRSSLTCLRQVAKEMNSIRRHVTSTTALKRSAAVPFVIPSEAEESAVSASQYQMLTGKPFCSSGALLPAGRLFPF